jgi:hypothetical protein
MGSSLGRDMSRKESTLCAGRSSPVPEFASEAEERRCWESHDSADYVDWSKAEAVRLPNLRPSTTSISLRLPVSLHEQSKVAAHKSDVPLPALIKTWLAEMAISPEESHDLYRMR